MKTRLLSLFFFLIPQIAFADYICDNFPNSPGCPDGPPQPLFIEPLCEGANIAKPGIEPSWSISLALDAQWRQCAFDIIEAQLEHNRDFAEIKHKYWPEIETQYSFRPVSTHLLTDPVPFEVGCGGLALWHLQHCVQTLALERIYTDAAALSLGLWRLQFGY